ncbi:hypothetical protein ACROYT_G031379 [Oculina patagonica]
MSEIKRLKRDPDHHLNKKSNEEQFNASKAIKDAVEDAQTALDNKHLQKTKEALDKVRKIASVCGKIISLGNCVGNVSCPGICLLSSTLRHLGMLPFTSSDALA